MSPLHLGPHEKVFSLFIFSFFSPFIQILLVFRDLDMFILPSIFSSVSLLSPTFITFQKKRFAAWFLLFRKKRKKFHITVACTENLGPEFNLCIVIMCNCLY